MKFQNKRYNLCFLVILFCFMQTIAPVSGQSVKPVSAPEDSGPSSSYPTVLRAPVQSYELITPPTANPDDPVASGQSLDRDRLILSPEKETTIPEKLCTVTCAPQAVAYVCQSNRGLAVFALDSKSGNDIKVVVGNKSVAVPIGTEVVLTEMKDAKFEDVNPKTGILFRAPQLEGTVGDVHIFRCQFMIESAAREIDGIRRLSTSNKPEEKDILKRILKNAAILQSSASREFVNRMRIATVCGAPQGSNPCRHRKSVQSDKIVSATQSALTENDLCMLHGSVEMIDGTNGRAIDLTTNQSREMLCKSEPDVHWLTEGEDGWMALDSRGSCPWQTTALITCSEDCLLKTEISNIICKRGSSVFIDNQETDLTVCTLDSNGLHDVMVHLPSGNYIKVPSGRALVLHKNTRFDSEPRQAHLLGYRSWSWIKVGDVDVYGADFSLPLAMYRIGPLRHMVSSKNSTERRRAASILKNAAILADIDP